MSKKTPLQFGIFFLKKLNMVTQILSIGTLPCFYFFHFQCSGFLVCFFFDKNLNFFRILTLSYIFSDYSTKNSCQEKFYFIFKGHNVYLDQKVSFNNLHHTKGSIFSVLNRKKAKNEKRRQNPASHVFFMDTVTESLYRFGYNSLVFSISLMPKLSEYKFYLLRNHPYFH